MPARESCLHDEAISVLSAALELESSSLLSALEIARPFLDWADADDLRALRRLADEEAAHIQELSAAVLRLGGVPPPRRLNSRVAGLHYLGLAYLARQLAQDKRRLIRGYEALDQGCQGDFPGRELLARLRAAHESHIDALDSMGRQPVG